MKKLLFAFLGAIVGFAGLWIPFIEGSAFVIERSTRLSQDGKGAWGLIIIVLSEGVGAVGAVLGILVGLWLWSVLERREARLAWERDAEYLRKRRIKRRCLIIGVIVTAGIGFTFDIHGSLCVSGYRGFLSLVGVPLGVGAGWVAWRILEQKVKWPTFCAACTVALIAGLFGACAKVAFLVPLGAALGAIAGHLLHGASHRAKQSAATTPPRPEDEPPHPQPGTSEPTPLRPENTFVWLLLIAGGVAGAWLSNWLAWAVATGVFGIPATAADLDLLRAPGPFLLLSMLASYWNLLLSPGPILLLSILASCSALGAVFGLRLGDGVAPFLWAKIAGRGVVRSTPLEHEPLPPSGQSTDSALPAGDCIHVHPAPKEATRLRVERIVVWLGAVLERRETRLASDQGDKTYSRERRIKRGCMIIGLIVTVGVGLAFDVSRPYGYAGFWSPLGVPLGVLAGWLAWRILEQKVKWPAFWAALTVAFIAGLFATLGWKTAPELAFLTALTLLIPLGAALGAVAGHLLRGASNRTKQTAATTPPRPEDEKPHSQPAASESTHLRPEITFVWLLRISGVVAGAGLGYGLALAAVVTGLATVSPATSASLRLLASLLLLSMLLSGPALGAAAGLRLGERCASPLWTRIARRRMLRATPTEHEPLQPSGQGANRALSGP